MPHYINPQGQLIHTPDPLEIEWPAVFVTGVLQPATDREYIIMGLEGFFLKDQFPGDVPKLWTAGIIQLAHALCIQPRRDHFLRAAEARGINWRIFL